MKALVTGATGFVGANLVRTLLKKGVIPRVLVRSKSLRKNIEGLSVEIVDGDICDPSSLSKACEGCDLLFHSAAFYDFWSSDPTIFYKVNVEGTKNILEAATRAKISKIVYTSTVGAIRYPKDPSAPSDETCFPSEKDLHNDYKRSKFQAEQLAIQYAQKGFPIVIVNPSAPIGPFDVKPTPTGKIIVDFLNGKVPAYVDTGLNVIDVEDVAEGHWLASQKGRMGERYILGNKNLSLREIYCMIWKLTGKDPPKFRIPYGVAFTAGLVSEWIARFSKTRPRIPLGAVRMAKNYMYFDSSKAVRELGLPQSPVEKAFEKAIRWFRENGHCR